MCVWLCCDIDFFGDCFMIVYMENRISIVILLGLAALLWIAKPATQFTPRGLVGLVPGFQAYAITPDKVHLVNELPPFQNPVGVVSIQLSTDAHYNDSKGAMLKKAKALAANAGAHGIYVNFFGQAGPSYLLRGLLFA